MGSLVFCQPSVLEFWKPICYISFSIKRKELKMFDKLCALVDSIRMMLSLSVSSYANKAKCKHWRISPRLKRNIWKRQGGGGRKLSPLIGLVIVNIAQFLYINIQPQTIDFSTRLRGINYGVCGVVSPKPRGDVYCFKLNVKISKLVYWAIVLQNTCTNKIVTTLCLLWQFTFYLFLFNFQHFFCGVVWSINYVGMVM